MSWITIVLALLKYGPAVIELVSEIFELIKKLRDRGNKDEAVFAEASFGSAMSVYKREKDRKLLLALRDHLRRRCDGPDCAA